MRSKKSVLQLVLIVFLVGGVSTGAAERTIQIPSIATGTGNLTLRITYPDDPADYRYAEGAPVAVLSPGGHEPGSLAAGMGWTDAGFVSVTFLYPGGSDGPYSSDGVYDYRGENCIQALRDVVLYAQGQYLDIMGNSIHELVPGTVVTRNMGILSSSNGGPTTTAMLGRSGLQLDGVKYLVYVESPTNDQTVNIDLGGVGYDCDPMTDGDGNGLAGDDGKNIHYTAYGTSSCEVDYSNLAYDPAEVRSYIDPAGIASAKQISGLVFFDNNQNGTVDYIDTPPCYDVNGNGTMDPDEDYPLWGKITFDPQGDVTLYLSTEVARAAQQQNIFGGSWPDHIAEPEDTNLFWMLRDSTLYYDEIAGYYPDMRVMLLCSETDHAQAADDHPHIQQAYDGFRSHGIWCRLNPDYAYIQAIVPGTPPPGTQDNDANITVSPGDMKQYTNPDTLNAQIAGMCEMADRIYYSVWDDNLSSVISGATPTPAPTWTPAPPDMPPLYLVSMMHAEESIDFHQNPQVFNTHANNLRAHAALLHTHGATLDVGPDWTFIEAVKLYDSTLLTDLIAMGHGVHTHAHESQYDLGEVNAKLLEAGLSDNIVSNGGFLQTGPGNTNWVGYVADFTDNLGNPIFQISMGYKDPNTQIVDGCGYAFRPSQTGDWHTPDPEGSIVYLGSNMPNDVAGGGQLDFDTIRDWMNDVLSRIEPNRINTMYWHDSVHNYHNASAASHRMAQWKLFLEEYLNPLVAEGRIEWKNFTEIGQLYMDWEQSVTPTPVPTGCVDTGVTLQMPSNYYRTGDECWCQVNVCNASGDIMASYPLFVVLDVYGEIFFGPSFTGDFDHYGGSYPEFDPGMTVVEVLPLFNWPSDVGSAAGIKWYAALTDPGITEIVGTWDQFSFGWGQ